MKKESRRTRFVRARICSGADTTTEVSITVSEGRIESIDAKGGLGMVDVDLHGLLVLPGAIDGHVHFDDPGFTYRESFDTGTLAASAGGVTTVVDMPCTSLPPVTDAVTFERKLKVIAPKARVDFALWGGVRGNGFSIDLVRNAFRALYPSGVRCIKTYLISGMPTFEDLSLGQLEDVMRLAREVGLTVGVHAEDKSLVLQGVEREKAAADADSILAYARSRNAEAESKGVETCIRLAERTGTRVHVVHLACGQGVRMIREAKARGVAITAETCPQYLAFTDEDLARMGSLLKTAPVVKKAEDRDALWEGIADGTIDMIATDHAPANWPVEKETGSIWTDYGGVPGVETLVPFVLSEAVQKKRITLERAIELLCSGPARVHGIASRKGGLEAGMDADFAVVDPDCSWVVRAADLFTRQKYTPFEGAQWTSQVVRTFVRGHEVFDRERGPVGDPCGRLVFVDHASAA